jgi:diguanylate cyclase (GGDEF)-like protein
MSEPEAAIQLKGKILVADDEEEFRRLLSRRAERLGLAVDQASDGKKALEAVRSNRYDLLILDIYMPGASGLEVLKVGREGDPDLQAIVMTAYATVNNAIEALRAGAYDYLVKPLDSLEAFDLALKRAMGFRELLKENRRLFEEVQRLAITDALTGLYNRRRLDEALELELERVRRYGRSLSTIMIDLDNLKHINDEYGHPAGDEVLKQVASVIQSQVRRIDIPVRYGGDEFLILLPEASLKDATILAERIAARCQDLSIGDDFVSFSLGVVEWGPGISSTEDLLFEADQALYEAKQAGGKRIAAGQELLLAWPE